MLDSLTQQPADALLALIKLHDADNRADKIDLGVGVFRTETGATPVFAAIKEAEKRLLAEQDSKAYLGPEGDMGFVHALMPYIFGAGDPARGGRIDGMQAPGGTGGLRLAFALAKRAGIRRIVVGNPTWPNHPQILDDLGLETLGFAHAGADGAADMNALRAAVAQAGEGDAFLLHGCCHNPTGIDYSPADWDEIARLVAERGILPILDLAYQGLGHGMEEDAYGLRAVLAAVPEALICYSCDKNFGLYRDRVGALYVMGKDADSTGRILSHGHSVARTSWSQPPDHGAAAVRLILEDQQLTRLWLDELAEMRDRMRQMREMVAAADNRVAGLDLAPIARQNGLFSMLALSKEQILKLREDHGIYMAGSGRINVAGLTRANMDKFIAALAQVAG
ncbi:amino acid aminotransferase [Tsuneonella sp. CC-YZS046]|uniref:amino acid aminotransferase n=1 Tax=Tsuneonella sp. CC-YZS046 TaxID=3042152 RepID=UPI002D76EB08|nr:amino acid aminotransferase [Tsuneonella sp. CC-YZS046]WRO66847.1 amino acid aminotransferase [Tsuneonella sp. CC-YZS046]